MPEHRLSCPIGERGDASVGRGSAFQLMHALHPNAWPLKIGMNADTPFPFCLNGFEISPEQRNNNHLHVEDGKIHRKTNSEHIFLGSQNE
jgi:hypothetical protein